MEITNQYNVYESNIESNNKENNSIGKTESFSSQVASEKTERKSDVLIFLDRHNAFDKLNEEDATLFRELLLNNSLDDKDMSKLSFEQTQTMRDFLLNTRNGDLSLPVNVFQGKSFELLGASSYTGDDQFNRAFYDTVLQTEDARVSASYFSILWENLSQIISGNELRPGYISNGPDDDIITKNFGPHNKDSVNIDFNGFLNNYKAKLQEKLNETQDNIEIFKQFKNDFDFYDKLLNNYNKYN